MDDVSLDGAEWFVSNQNKDLLLLLQADEVTEPGPLGQSAIICDCAVNQCCMALMSKFQL